MHDFFDPSEVVSSDSVLGFTGSHIFNLLAFATRRKVDRFGER
jgi:hypothetical protein